MNMTMTTFTYIFSWNSSNSHIIEKLESDEKEILPSIQLICLNQFSHYLDGNKTSYLHQQLYYSTFCDDETISVDYTISVPSCFFL